MIKYNIVHFKTLYYNYVIIFSQSPVIYYILTFFLNVFTLLRLWLGLVSGLSSTTPACTISAEDINSNDDSYNKKKKKWSKFIYNLWRKMDLVYNLSILTTKITFGPTKKKRKRRIVVLVCLFIALLLCIGSFCLNNWLGCTRTLSISWGSCIFFPFYILAPLLYTLSLNWNKC